MGQFCSSSIGLGPPFVKRVACEEFLHSTLWHGKDLFFRVAQQVESNLSVVDVRPAGVMTP